MRYSTFCKKGIYILAALIVTCHEVRAQDPVFTQAFLSPVYLNPGATGAGEHDLRISGIYRRQWWNVPSGMNYMAFSIDKYIPGINSGLGLMATKSSEGYLNKSGFYGSYAYNICAGTKSVAENGGTPKWFWTGGLQFGVAQNRIDYNKLVFSDQLTPLGVSYFRTNANIPVNNGKFFPDFAAGTFFNFNATEDRRLLVGFAGHHINTPDESLILTSDSFRSQLPILFTGSLLWTTTNTDNNWSFSYSLIAYRQAKNNSLQVGFEATQNEYDISMGIWYRGGINFYNMNALSLTVSFNLFGRGNTRDKMRVGLAHDAQVGNKGYSYTAGSSEFGFVWDHSSYSQADDNPCKPRINTLICPGRF